MEYKVWARVQDDDYIALSHEADSNTIEVTTVAGTVVLSAEEFRDLRKAVGYVWQEIEAATK